MLAALATALACSQPRGDSRSDERDDGAGSAVPLLVDASAPSAPVGDGVLADVPGQRRRIRVEQRDGRRLLYIGNTLHASVAWAGDRPDPAAIDPLVALLRTARPQAKTVLIIGLGSGDTAGDLAAAGLEVTAVEIDPAVIEVAKTWFAYRGKVVAGDGRAFLEQNQGPWDLVIMDAFDGTKLPLSMLDTTALMLLRERTTDSGATAMRMYGSPTDKNIERIRERLRHAPGPDFEHLFGSGVGTEFQNLYLVVAATPLNMTGLAEAAMWPVPDDISALGTIEIGKPGQLTDTTVATRDLTLVGYVHRLESGELALDLPHAEMGAVRYLLEGEPVSNLAATLPVDAKFPTMGDIGSDGDTSKTLRPLLGGGGAKRSDVRFSPVVAAISGSARLLAVVHPDVASRVPAGQRPGAVTDARIPYGGALYELTVTSVHWTMDRAIWSTVAPELDRRATTAGAAVSRGDLEAAAQELAAWSTALASKLGDQAELVPAIRVVRELSLALRHDRVRLGAATPFARGTSCDRLHQKFGNGAPPAVTAGLFRCAIDNYVTTAAGAKADDPNAYDAAARLAHLLDARDPRRAKLIKKFDIKQPMIFPPGSI
jgi:hypothetical protein